MDLPPPSRDVLAQPSRARLFAAIQAATAPISTEKLAEALGLHVNGVRRHLERLRQVGLVERSKSVGNRGRPRDEWSVAPHANPAGARPQAYADLSRWLTRVINAGGGRIRQVERTGREIGRELVPPGTDQSAESFRAALSALGFQPEMSDSDDMATCRLCNCPYRDAVRENPEIVCALHRGITKGLLDELAPKGRLAAFVPHDPDAAGCLVEIARPGWEA